MLNLYEKFWEKLEKLELTSDSINHLKEKTKEKLEKPIQGDYPRWLNAYSSLPNINTINIHLNQQAVTCSTDQCIDSQLKASMQQLIPWRKGPFDMFGCYIDAEWQSNMKWDRIASQIPDLENKLVLDVGCGNGYYMFRMAEKKAKLIMGIDPGLLQIMQFWSIEKYVQSEACVLPLSIQQMPQNLALFDVTFSMGVFYHRKSPIHHLKELAYSLKTGGYLVIETLVINGDERACLIPENRYAQMRNVWFLPSVSMLELMLKRTGFKNIKCIDITTTSIQEQRTTQWMKFHSLKEFLNNDLTKTIEGYDLPRRATIVAQKK